eukprot:5248894-Amphidinium_carterae.1
MDECSRSVETINITSIQDDYTADHLNRLRTKFSTIPAEDADDYDEHDEITFPCTKFPLQGWLHDRVSQGHAIMQPPKGGMTESPCEENAPTINTFFT